VILVQKDFSLALVGQLHSFSLAKKVPSLKFCIGKAVVFLISVALGFYYTNKFREKRKELVQAWTEVWTETETNNYERWIMRKREKKK
jgi:hypothetical protein